MFSRTKKPPKPSSLPLPGLDNGGTLNGLFVAGPGFPAVAVRVSGTARRLELRDGDHLLIAAWAWADVVPIRPPKPPDMTGLCLADRRFPSQQVVITDPTPIPKAPDPDPDPFVSPDAHRQKRAARRKRVLAADGVLQKRRIKKIRFRLSGTHKALVAGAVVLALGSLALLPVVQKPERIEALSRLVSPQTEDAWGTALMGQLQARGMPMCRTPSGQDALDQISQKMARNGSAPVPRIAVVASTLGQAFPLPGNRVVVTDALIASLESPDDLAAIVAFETAFSTQKSTAARIIRVRGLPALMALFLGQYDVAPVNVVSVLKTRQLTSEGALAVDPAALDLLHQAGLRSRSISVMIRQIHSAPAQTQWSGNPLLVPYGLFQPMSPERSRGLNATPRGGEPVLTEGAWEAVRRMCE